MNVTLRNVKIHDDISWKSRCFSATICVDGKPIGRAVSFGSSEQVQCWWTDNAQGHLLEEWVRTTIPRDRFTQDNENFSIYIEDLVAAHELRERYRRAIKATTLYMLKGDKACVYYQHHHVFTPKVAAALRKRHGDKLELIINEDIEAAIQFTLSALTAEMDAEYKARCKRPYVPSAGPE